MGLIVLPSLADGTAKARIGYQNLMESATSVVPTSVNADFPVENLWDWLTSDFYKPTGTGTTDIVITMPAPVSADYFAFYNQNLFSLSGTIKLQWWNGSAYVDCFSAISPADNSPQMVSFASQTSDKWRVVISCASVFSLGCVSFGAQLALEHGMYLNWTPPKFGRSTQLVTSKADGGAFLGRSVIAKGVSTELILQYASDTWMRANWIDFVEHAEKKPFFFVPDIANHPSEAVYCWVEDNIPAPVHTNYGFMGATIPIRGLVE